ncbi:citramalate synthase [Anaerolineae bacterium CFX9]|jgi:2-isopropylmalate synthase|nr:citramalate synthase [Geitlerinema splendidum]MDL1900420.1 citramalate synthase [Anaerolineae bacterium CFX9]
MQVAVYDTTLRDGTQREGISLSVADKLRITRMLDELGVHYIEGGWPGSNPKDAAYFDAVRNVPLKHARIAAFGSTCRKHVAPENDSNIRALIDADTPVVTVVGKTSMLHVTDVLQTTPDENLRMIRESIAYLRSLGKEVIYDAEHFFDGIKLDMEYGMDTLRAASDGGAHVITLCDTNGGTLPWEVAQFVRMVQELFPQMVLGIHTHNDAELAVANTLAAVQAGAVQVQGTINGYGERCGNANLCSIIPDLQLKMGYECLPPQNLRNLTVVSRAVAEIANLAPDNHLPYVGKSAFAHKGGIHVAAIRRNVDSYQHIDPDLVGNEMRVLVSDLSGQGNLLSKAEEFGLDVTSTEAVKVLDEIKRLESQGYVFEGSEASVAIRLYRARPEYKPLFTLIDFTTIVEDRRGRGSIAEAMVKLEIDGEVVITAAEGNGPVNALDLALRKALMPQYPQIADFQLADYKVRILDGSSGTAATTRVMIETQNGGKRWATVGAGENIIRASWLALVDSVEYGLCLAADEKHAEHIK